MNSLQKKKKFAYKAVINQPSNGKNIGKVEFPDDFQSLSQNSKRIKLEKTSTIKEDIIMIEDGDDLMDDDFDFSQAVDEINEIEMQATQMFHSKSIPNQPANVVSKINQPSDVLDELLASGNNTAPRNSAVNQNGLQSTFYLKIPKKKPPLNETTQNRDIFKDLSTEKYVGGKYISDKSVYEGCDNSQSILHHDSAATKENDSMALLNTYKTKMQEAEQKYLSKDGEIKILRETLRKLSEDERRCKDKIRELEYDLKTHQSEKESKLVSEVEKLKTQLVFKEKEIQDALDRNRKSLNCNVSPKVDPPHKKCKVGFITDGFESSDKVKQTASSSEIKQEQQETTIFQCKRLKKLFQANAQQTSPHEHLISNQPQRVNKVSSLKFKCDHSDSVSFRQNENYFCDLVSLFEFIDHDHFFIPEFVSKISHYIDVFNELSSSQNIQIIEENAPTKQKPSNIRMKNGIPNSVRMKSEYEVYKLEDCLICHEAFEICLKSIMVLSYGCEKYPKIKEYLLNGLLKSSRMEIEIPIAKSDTISVNSRQYSMKYPNRSVNILVDNMNISFSQVDNILSCDFNSAIHLWRCLRELIQRPSFIHLEESLFEFHISLISYPLQLSSTCHMRYLIDQDLVSKYLNTLSVDRILNVLRILQKFVGLRDVFELMCSKSDRCVLLLIYNWLINEESQNDQKLLIVFQQLVSLLSSLIACNHVSAYNYLLEGECGCSNEIIECLITFLFDQFKYLQKKVFLFAENESIISELTRLSCFRQGMSLLCLLCSNEKNLVDKRSAVEWNYIYLVAGTIKMYRKIPSINDKEVLDLEDLLDMDQYIDFDIASEKMDAEVSTSSISTC